MSATDLSATRAGVEERHDRGSASVADQRATGEHVLAPAADARPAEGRVRYDRVLLKLSGEALLGERPYGVDPEFCSFVAGELKAVHDVGVQVAVVVGGGNIFRGLAAAAEGMDRATGDYIGMLSSVINALVLQDALEYACMPTGVLPAIAMPEVAEPVFRRRTFRHLAK